VIVWKCKSAYNSNAKLTWVKFKKGSVHNEFKR
jgi:hypothetical protein